VTCFADRMVDSATISRPNFSFEYKNPYIGP
jgi:hypothetical protein